MSDRQYYKNEITPYNDIKMTYDTNSHRYTLTIDYVDTELNVNFTTLAGDIDEAKQRLREVSGDFYKFIYKYNRRDSEKRKTDEHRLAKNGDFRDTIADTMIDMVRAWIRSGYSLDKDASWINNETSTVMDLSNIPSIAPDAIEGLFAYGILHKGSYNYTIDDDDYRSDY